MSEATRPSWERFSDAMLDWGGYLLLAFATFLGVLGRAIRIRPGRRRPWRIAAVAALWLYVGYTRRPLPNIDHRLRLDVFFVGLLVLASILMLRQPLFFIFMIAGFFYATILRPLPLAVVGIAASSILVNTLIAGLPQTAEAWTFYLAIIGVQTIAISAGAVFGEKVTEQSEERRAGARPARGGAGGERRPPRPAAHPGTRGGHPRRAAADGARDPRHDRPGPDRDHHAARGGRPGERSPGRPGSPPRRTPSCSPARA